MTNTIEADMADRPDVASIHALGILVGGTTEYYGLKSNSFSIVFPILLGLVGEG